MSSKRSPWSLIRRVALPAVGLLIIANFVGYAVMGDNGVMSWGDYRRASAERATILAQLEQERAQLQHRARLLDPRHADPDLADELARKDLGVVHQDEVIVPLN